MAMVPHWERSRLRATYDGGDVRWECSMASPLSSGSHSGTTGSQ